MSKGLKHKQQRVGVFIDVQNIYYSAKALYKRKVNFDAIVQNALAGRQLIRAFAYVIEADNKEEQSFFDALENLGIEVRSKKIQSFYGGRKKGDWDVGIAMDVLRLAPKLDVVVLVSGDGDFVPLVEYVQANNGCRVEVIAFSRSASGNLQEVSDDFLDLAAERVEDYLLYPSRSKRHHPRQEVKSESKQEAKPASQPEAK